MAAPFFRLGRYNAIGGGHRQSQAPGTGQHRMPLSSWPELGIQPFGSTGANDLPEQLQIAGEENEAPTILSQNSG
jgi:hypothetical protein